MQAKEFIPGYSNKLTKQLLDLRRSCHKGYNGLQPTKRSSAKNGLGSQ